MTSKPFLPPPRFKRNENTSSDIHKHCLQYKCVTAKVYTEICVIYDELVGTLEWITNIELCSKNSPLLVPCVRMNEAMKKKYCNFIRC